MTPLRALCLAWATCLVGVGGGAGAARVTWAEPTPAASAERYDCGEVDALRRPLLALPAVAPTPGFHPRSDRDVDFELTLAQRSDIDFARATDERNCLALPTCVTFDDHAVTDDVRYAVVLGASRIGSERSATLRIASNGDGLGVPPYASDAAIHEGDLVPTVAGPVRIVSIRAHDPDTQVVARFVEPGAHVELARFFLGPNIGAFVLNRQLSLSWKNGVAHVSARRVLPLGSTVSVEPPVEQDVSTTMTIDRWRYRVVSTHAATAADPGWIELDARPDPI